MLTGYPSLPAMDSNLLVRRSPDPRLEPAFEFIHANLHDRIRTCDLAKLSGLSGPRFSHLFTLATGVTPGKYLRNLRAWRLANTASAAGPATRRSRLK
jgi:transcriptional regulator GlxA family with amidase domain